MKKASLIALLIITAMLAAVLVSCGNDRAQSSTDESLPPESSEVSKTEESSVQSEPESQTPSEPSEEPSDEESEPEESSEPEETLPEYISNFLSFAELSTKLRAGDATSVRLTAVNQPAGYGDIVIFTCDYEELNAKVADGNYEDFAFFIADYSNAVFGNVKKAYYGVGEVTSSSSLIIPDDGFVVAAHKTRDVMIKRLSQIESGTKLYVAGIQICDVNFSASETVTPITVDGVIDSEWDAFLVDTIDETNEKWEYLKFTDGFYYTTADYYVTYDKDNLYLAVVVNSPYHHCPLSQEEASSMWKYECIQVKLSIKSPKSDYILEHYDHVIDPTANNEGIVRAYGFAVSNSGETLYYENSPKNKTFIGTAACVRDDGEQKTVYEIAFPWSEFGEEVLPDEIGLTFSINSTNEDDVASGNWRNLVLRDGGGVINRNDWAKIPAVTLVPAVAE